MAKELKNLTNDKLIVIADGLGLSKDTDLTGLVKKKLVALINKAAADDSTGEVQKKLVVLFQAALEDDAPAGDSGTGDSEEETTEVDTSAPTLRYVAQRNITRNGSDFVKGDILDEPASPAIDRLLKLGAVKKSRK